MPNNNSNNSNNNNGNNNNNGGNNNSADKILRQKKKARAERMLVSHRKRIEKLKQDQAVSNPNTHRRMNFYNKKSDQIFVQEFIEKMYEIEASDKDLPEWWTFRVVRDYEALGFSYLYKDFRPFAALKDLGFSSEAMVKEAVDFVLDGKEITKNQAEIIADMKRKVALKKIESFYPTPNSVIDLMINMAESQIGSLSGKHGIEPSAGYGSIADKLLAIGATVDCVEVNYDLVEIMSENGHNVYRKDILEFAKTKQEAYDFAIMNPPFENNQSAIHVMAVYDTLKPQSVLISVMPSTVRNGNNYEKFRSWLKSKNFSLEDLPSDAFKDSDVPVGVRTLLLMLYKNEQE